ncbi:Uncharacterised protein [Mycobacteroides abscessus subsp. abscessus]|nr:Uncharacterised protein [Mycobacteroides abscessus subsp. abscessus]
MSGSATKSTSAAMAMMTMMTSELMRAPYWLEGADASGDASGMLTTCRYSESTSAM